MQHEPRLFQPLPEPIDRGGVVIVEMAARREDFHGAETVRGDLGQMLSAQPLIMVQVRGDTELHETTDLSRVGEIDHGGTESHGKDVQAKHMSEGGPSTSGSWRASSPFSAELAIFDPCPCVGD